jgi:translation elongation factor EF-1alpha
MFDMPIDDVAETPHGMVIVCGRVNAGEVRRGDNLLLQTTSDSIPVQVVDLLAFGYISAALAGDNVGVAVSGIRKDAITVGGRLVGRNNA